MKDSVRSKLSSLKSRLADIDVQLAQPSVIDDMDAYRRLGKERNELFPVVSMFDEYQAFEAALLDAKHLVSDPDLGEMAAEEVRELEQKIEAQALALQTALLPQDPDDDKNIILEIRAGTGGEESALFAGSLFRMYSRLAERQRWQMEVLSSSESDLGGYKEIICRLVGTKVYSRLKFESGGHRVQRVPETETQGRVHTSACTVAVMPEADEVSEIELNPADLRIDTFRASGAGGQHINKTDSAVRIIHIPTGIVAECQDGRSQHQNKASALRVLATRIRDIQQRKQDEHISSTRKILIGSGDRSERIRTYNYPQGRITDHRINLTLYKLAFILDGDMDELLTALATEHQMALLASMGE